MTWHTSMLNRISSELAFQQRDPLQLSVVYKMCSVFKLPSSWHHWHQRPPIWIYSAPKQVGKARWDRVITLISISSASDCIGHISVKPESCQSLRQRRTSSHILIQQRGDYNSLEAAKTLAWLSCFPTRCFKRHQSCLFPSSRPFWLV